MKNLLMPFLLTIFSLNASAQCNLKINLGEDKTISCGDSIKLGPSGNFHLKIGADDNHMFTLTRTDNSTTIDSRDDFWGTDGKATDKWYNLAPGNYRIVANSLTTSDISFEFPLGKENFFYNDIRNKTYDFTITDNSNYTFNWTPNKFINSTNILSPKVSPIQTTSYYFTAQSGNCIYKDTIQITVNPLKVTIADITVACGNNANLSVKTNYSGTGNLTYLWSPSTGLSSSSIANPIATIKNKTNYSVEIKTPNGCVSTDNVDINTSVTSYYPNICMVSVNENDKNVIVWQRTTNLAIDSFYIYSESKTQTGKYDLIGRLPYNATGEFIDTASNARVQSNKYKIAVKDVCGNLTSKSPEHKTMHLIVYKGIGNVWNLIWEQYTGQMVSSYKIFRGTSKANLVEIGSSSGSNTTYTDENAPDGILYYVVEVILPQACTNLKSAGYTSSRSNITRTSDASAVDYTNLVIASFFYPNPANNKLNLNNMNLSNAKLLIYDLQGKQVLTQQIESSQIDISGISKGIYTVKLIYLDNIFINKLIKE